MIEVIPNIYVGGDADYARVSHRPGFSVIRCCKFGQGGHKEVLGYSTQKAPEGPNYLWVKKGNLLALNLLDFHDPNFIPFELVEHALKFAKERLNAGDKILFACNQGKSRGPSMAFMFLRSINELPYNFARSESVFKTLYPDYNPKEGIRQVARHNWSNLAPKEISNE